MSPIVSCQNMNPGLGAIDNGAKLGVELLPYISWRLKQKQVLLF
jgi:hypothetical protein